MSGLHPVRFYFDFVSPYSWLALTQATRFAGEHRVRWEPCPVVYAALLDATGLVGPAEVPAKRRHTFRDVVRCAHRLGLRLTGPPTHPFRSLGALRTLCLFREHPRAVELAAALADACWADGRPLTDVAVIADVVAAAGFDARDLAARIATPAVKQELHRLTAQALADGAFGVPSFVWDNELFWGHDRMQHLAERLAGTLPAAAPGAEALLARPRGADRRNAPRQRDA